MPFELPPLPYAEDALAPHMSAETLQFHHGKHHKTYVDKLNQAIEGTDDANKSLEEIILSASGPLFNNAAQTWNHTFFWNSMKPGGGGAPTGPIADAIGSAFGSYDAFKEKFAAEAVGHFASGWAWLVEGDKGLEVISTHDADLPMKHGLKAILTCDVWEHAYYIDYRNVRPDYLSAYLDHLVNWDWANQQLGS